MTSKGTSSTLAFHVCALGGSNDHTIHTARVVSGQKIYLPWELTIADGIYFGSPHILAKFPRNYNDITAGGVNIHIPLTPEQEAANRVISHDRQRIEHVIGMINRHQLFRRPWAGGVLALVNAMHVTCHLTNIKTKWQASTRHRRTGTRAMPTWLAHGRMTATRRTDNIGIQAAANYNY